MMNSNYFRNLINLLINIKTTEEMDDFLRGILTPKELAEISTRLEIVKMLKKGIVQHEISEKLGVGVATITRGSREIQKGRFKTLNNKNSWQTSAQNRGLMSAMK